MYKWMSLDTGVVVENFDALIKEVLNCFFSYHRLYIRWSYNPMGW